MNANGTFSYVHDGSETTSDTFTYAANDGTINGNAATVTITINPINDPPVAIGDIVMGIYGATVSQTNTGSSTLLSNDYDPEGASITASTTIAVSPLFGSVNVNADGTFSYTHNGTSTPTVDTFSYIIFDGTLYSPATVVSITFTIPPVGVSDQLTVLEGGSTTVLTGSVTSVLANDSDSDGDPITAVLIANPTYGSLTLNANGTFSYVHDGSETTSDTFTYAANDGYINGNTVTVTISITPVNDPPVTVVGSDTLILDEAGTVTITSGGGTSLLDNDTDAEGDTLVAIGVSSPTNGTITINPDGTFTYVHDGSDTTTDTFSYKVNDGTADGNTVTITITINPVNDPPVAVGESLVVDEAGTVTLTTTGSSTLLDNDSDAEGDAITAVVVSNPTYGALTLNANGTFSYVHDGSETTSDTFTYAANDGTINGNAATVTITINPINDPPVTVVGSDTLSSMKPVRLLLPLVGGHHYLITIPMLKAIPLLLLA